MVENLIKDYCIMVEPEEDVTGSIFLVSDLRGSLQLLGK